MTDSQMHTAGAAATTPDGTTDVLWVGIACAMWVGVTWHVSRGQSTDACPLGLGDTMVVGSWPFKCKITNIGGFRYSMSAPIMFGRQPFGSRAVIVTVPG